MTEEDWPEPTQGERTAVVIIGEVTAAAMRSDREEIARQLEGLDRPTLELVAGGLAIALGELLAGQGVDPDQAAGAYGLAAEDPASSAERGLEQLRRDGLL